MDINKITNDNKKINLLTKSNIIKKTYQTSLQDYNFKIKKKYDIVFPNMISSGEIKICSWNINGLRSIINKNKIIDLITNEAPDILCLIETKIDLITLNRMKFRNYLKGYLSYWNCSNDRPEYSGIGIFTKYKPLNIKYGLENNPDGRIITLEFNNMYVVAILSPYSGKNNEKLTERLKWENELNEYILKLKTNKSVVLCGDFNIAYSENDLFYPIINVNNSGFLLEERESFKKILENFIDCFRYLNPFEIKFTYFPANDPFSKILHRGWRFDYFLLNKEALNSLSKCEIMNQYLGSDHAPIKLVLNIK